MYRIVSSVFLLTMFLVSSSLTQVRIREKISINPQSTLSKPSSSTPVTHSLRFEASWTGPADARLTIEHRFPFLSIGGCLSANRTGTGSITHSIPLAPAGIYDLELGNIGQALTTATVRIFLDDQLVQQQTSTGFIQLTYSTPYVTGFRLAFPSPRQILYEESMGSNVQARYDCGTSSSWNPSTDQITLTIVSGSQYAQFWEITDPFFGPRVPRGSTVTIFNSTLIAVAADGTLPDSAGAWVAVTAESKGILQRDSILVKPYFYSVEADPAQIQVLGESVLRIRTVDVNGNEHFRASQGTLARVRLVDSVSKYGTLSLPWYGQEGDTLNDVEAAFTVGASGTELKFLANEQSPSDTIDVSFVVEKTGEGSSTEFIPPELWPYPGRDSVRGVGKVSLIGNEEVKCAVVHVDPPDLGANQIANVLIFEKKSNQDEVPFPEGQKFDVRITEGGEFVDIVSAAGDTADVLEDVALPIKLITRNALGVSFKISASPHMSLGMRAMHTRAMQVLASIASNGTDGVIQDGGNICVLPGPMRVDNEEILLGETKYYRTRMSESGVFYIEPSGPALGEGIPGDVWKEGENLPVYKISGPIGGLPIYWEKGKPIPDGSGNLPTGVIRVVGRYWSSNGAYIAGLTANDGDKNAFVTIEVKKPAKLLTSGQSPDYRKSRDIRDDEIDIDDLIVRYAGEFGIPPQFLKGQVFEESFKEELGRFWPTYRYEPWFDLRSRNQKEIANVQEYLSQPYWVTESGMGLENGGESVPTDHQNVRPLLSFSSSNSYPSSPMRVGDYVADNLSRYYSGSGLSRDYASRMGGPGILNIFWPILIDFYGDLYENTQRAIDSSDLWIRNYLRANYNDAWAQTRKASSYGYFQMLYTTAIEAKVGYPRKSGNIPAPEKLIDQDIQFPLACKFLSSNANSILSEAGQSFGANNWSSGYEVVWRESYPRFNRRQGYGLDVLRSARRFLPSR